MLGHLSLIFICQLNSRIHEGWQNSNVVATSGLPGLAGFPITVPNLRCNIYHTLKDDFSSFPPVQTNINLLRSTSNALRGFAAVDPRATATLSHECSFSPMLLDVKKHMWSVLVLDHSLAWGLGDLLPSLAGLIILVLH